MKSLGKILIKSGSICVEGEIFDTKTGRKVFEVLPIKSNVSTWGKEIYFPIPVVEELEKDAKEKVEKGDIGYWPVGKSFCIFFGRTPKSKKDDEIIPASPVNIFGKITSNVLILENIKDGDEIEVIKK
jgi:hypothetical protein